MYDCIMCQPPACSCAFCGDHVETFNVHVQQRRDRDRGRDRYWHLICWMRRGEQLATSPQISEHPLNTPIKQGSAGSL
jgi:hypothetical protein